MVENNELIGNSEKINTETIEELKTKINNLKKTQKAQEKIINSHYTYLTKSYGENYNSIPPKIVRHDRAYKLKQRKNSTENFNVLINRLKDLNNNFLFN